MFNESLVRKLAPSVFATEAHPDASARYRFLSTADAIEAIEAHGYMVTSASQSVERNPVDGKNFNKHQVRMRAGKDLAAGSYSYSRPVGERAQNRSWGDVAAELIITNSHNRSGAFSIHQGLHRFECLNGLITPVSGIGLGEGKFRHSGKTTSELVADAVAVLAAESAAVIEMVGAMHKVKMDRAAQIQFAKEAIVLYAGTDEAKVLNGYDVDSAIRPMRALDEEPTLWTTFNVLQERVVRGGIKRTSATGRDTETQGLSNISRLTEMNVGLWDLAKAKLAA